MKQRPVKIKSTAQTYAEIYADLLKPRGPLHTKLTTVGKADYFAAITSDEEAQEIILQNAATDLNEELNQDQLLTDDMLAPAAAFFADDKDVLLLARAQTQINTIDDLLLIIKDAQINQGTVLAFPYRKSAHFVSIVVDTNPERQRIIFTNSGEGSMQEIIGDLSNPDSTAFKLNAALKAKFGIASDFTLVETQPEAKIKQSDVLCNFHAVLNNIIFPIRIKNRDNLDKVKNALSALFGEEITGGNFAELIADAQYKYNNLDFVKQELSAAFAGLEFAPYQNLEEIIQTARKFLLNEIISQQEGGFDLFKTLYLTSHLDSHLESSEILSRITTQSDLAEAQYQEYFKSAINKYCESADDQAIKEKFAIINKYSGGDTTKKVNLQKRLVLAAKIYRHFSQFFYHDNLSQLAQFDFAQHSAKQGRFLALVNKIAEFNPFFLHEDQKRLFQGIMPYIEKIVQQSSNSKAALWQEQMAITPYLELAHENIAEYLDGQSQNEEKDHNLELIKTHLKTIAATPYEIRPRMAVNAVMTLFNRNDLAISNINELLLLEAQDGNKTNFANLLTGGANILHLGATRQESVLERLAVQQKDRNFINFIIDQFIAASPAENLRDPIMKALRIATNTHNNVALECLLEKTYNIIDIASLNEIIENAKEKYIRRNEDYKAQSNLNLLLTYRALAAAIQGKRDNAYLQKFELEKIDKQGNTFMATIAEPNITFVQKKLAAATVETKAPIRRQLPIPPARTTVRSLPKKPIIINQESFKKIFPFYATENLSEHYDKFLNYFFSDENLFNQDTIEKEDFKELILNNNFLAQYFVKNSNENQSDQEIASVIDNMLQSCQQARKFYQELLQTNAPIKFSSDLNADMKTKLQKFNIKETSVRPEKPAAARF